MKKVPARTRLITDAARVLNAFDEIDRVTGRHNYVTFQELRKVLPKMSRTSVDSAVRELRIARVLTADSADGRHERLPPETIAAGIPDESTGVPLVYLARRK
jgi:hypothetical protein